MDTLLERLEALSSAEEFLSFFAVSHEASVVQAHRRQILERFHQYLREQPGLDGLDDIALYRRYRGLLAHAYADFVRPTPARDAVFKRFQEAGPRHRLLPESMRGARPALRSPLAA
jgi:nitrogenase-stabilizing/protective protein